MLERSSTVAQTPAADTPIRRRPSIRASLITLVVACLTPGLLVSGYLVHENYAQHRARLERDAVLQARSLAAAVDYEFSGVMSGLRVLSTSPDLAAGDLRAFHGRARDALDLQSVAQYVLFDRQGRQLVNTARDFGQPLPSAGALSELQRVFETGKPVVTGVFIAPATGTTVIGVGVPVFRGEQVVYSLNAGLSPERIAAVLQRRAIPGHWVAAVLDGTGTIVARTRDPEKFVGQKATPDVVAFLSSGQVEGVIRSRSMEGFPTYAAATRSSVSDWSVVVGAPRAAIEAELRTSIAWLAAGAAAAYGVGIWFAVQLSARVGGSIRGLVGPALLLGSGQPVAHTPPTRLEESEAVAQAILRAGRMLEDAQHLAQHDPLTGLPNRQQFDSLVGSRLAEARRRGTRLALLAIDLDSFKAVNDMHGHSAGDAVLQAAALRISGLLRESDVVARLGGDEFAVALSEVSLGDAQHVADKLVDALSAPYAGVVPVVSGSVGIAMYPAAGHTVAELLDRADQALYEAKRSGKRCVAVFG